MKWSLGWLRRPGRRRSRRAALAVALAASGIAVVFGSAAGQTPPARAAGSPAPTSGDTVQPEIGLPASEVMVFGASSQTGNAGEVWATGEVGDFPLSLSGGQSASDGYVLLQHTTAGGWQGVSVSGGATDGPLPARPEYGAQSGRATPDGGVALWVTSLLSGPSLVTVNPGGDTGQTVSLPQAGGGVLDAGETLLPAQSGPHTIPFAAIDDSASGGNQTGVLIAPQNDGVGGTVPAGVLDYDPTNATPWRREPVEELQTGATFTPLALACGPTDADESVDAPSNCWMLANVGQSGSSTLTIYERSSDGSSPTGEGWFPQSVIGDGGVLSGTAAEDTVTALGSGGAQMLTVTDQGVWVDFQAAVGNGSTNIDATELLEPGPAADQVSSQGTWCDPNVGSPYCTGSLGGAFPSTGGYLSYAWGGTGTGDDGERIISGGAQGTLLEFSGASDFSQVAGTGEENSGTEVEGGAFDTPTEGWLSGAGPALDGEGAPQAEEFTNSPVHDALTSDSVPFGSPLLGVASAPDTTPGDPNARAFAVGVDGEVAQHVPGSGWTPEALLNSAGQTQTPTLRGVAWPEARRAYAVGDNGAMWVWQGDTGLWEPDPAKPFNFDENLTGIAFDPGNPDLGWAVGKDGTMLQFGKSWTQALLPTSLQNVDFTSIAFAGNVALATYRGFDAGGLNRMYFTGGLAINTGAGWVPDDVANQVLSAIPAAPASPNPGDTLLSKVAGLPDGGAVAAGPGVVIETNNVTSAAWTTSPQPLPEAANISAVAAYRQAGGGIGAMVSIEANSNLDPNGMGGNGPDGIVPTGWTDEEPATVSAGGPPAFQPADPFPDSGYLVEQTSSGSWGDMEHMTYPEGGESTSLLADVPIRPDPVLALLVNSTGTEGLAVGGQTGDVSGTATSVSASLAQSETAGIMRFGAGAAASTGTGNAQLSANASEANFVLGGDAACVTACSDESGLSLAPDVSLVSALQEARQISGVRGFLYDGGRFVGDPGFGSGTLDGELGRLNTLIAQGSGGTMPVYVAPSVDMYGSGDNTGLTSFVDELPSEDPSAPQGLGYYSFPSTSSSGGTVLVIVLDFSGGNAIDPVQLGWLQTQLGDAKTDHEPAIVMGADSLGFTLPDPDTVGPDEALDGSTVIQTLVQGDASAYLFDYPSANVQTKLTYGGASIPAFGSGTLGYVQPPSALGDSLGSSATLVISVQTARRNASTNVAPVTAAAIPDIQQLAIDATDGTLLRRSQVALFNGLARRPLEGTEWQANSSGGPATFLGPQPYDPIPNDCQGRNCSYQIPEQFSFTSSKPAIGNFVEHDASSSNPLDVALGSNQLPIADASSGLFCAFNAGTTTITLTAGDLTYSMPVTVQSGSVEYPCGTVPAPESSSSSAQTGVSIPPIKTSAPHVTPKVTHPRIPVTVPPPPVPAHHTPAPQPSRPVPAASHPHALPPVPRGASSVTPVPSIAPAPPAPAARPVPPSGTSQVPSNSSVAENIPAAQKEREKLAATQGVEAMAAHDPDGPLPIPAWTIPLMVLALATGAAGIRRRGRQHDQFAWVGRAPRAGSQAQAKTWRRPPPGGGRR